jgi:hypothetical protein
VPVSSFQVFWKTQTLPMPTDPVLKWLLKGDAAIRWQALRDLKGASERTVRREQRRVAETGFGAQLLALQDADGRWAGGIYTPKWTSTTYTMVLLRSLGWPRAIRRPCGRARCCSTRVSGAMAASTSGATRTSAARPA